MGGISPQDRLWQARNEAATIARVDAAIARYKAETLEQQAQPKIAHHPINPDLQTGESRKLGGAMEVRAEHAQGDL